MKTSFANLVKVYPDAMPRRVCENFIQIFEVERERQLLNGKQKYQHLSGSQWTEMDMDALLAPPARQALVDLIADYKKHYESDCGIEPPLPDAPALDKFILKRYDNNGEDCFEVHFDSVGPVAGRYLVFLWYLNDVAEGGETCFPDLELSIRPQAGSLLMFPPYWMFRHQGVQPRSGAKYILSTYLMW